MVIANLTGKTIEMHARLTEQVTPFNNALQMPDVASDAQPGDRRRPRACSTRIVTQQAAMIAYLNDFKLLMVLTLAMIPLVLIIGTAAPPGPKRQKHARVID